MTTKEDTMGTKTPADIVLQKSGPHYRAVPPAYRAHPPTRGTVLVRNLTGHGVTVWSPQGVLLDTPRPLVDGDEYPFPINPDKGPGAYIYTAYVDDEEQLVEGNSPPVIIIDK